MMRAGAKANFILLILLFSVSLAHAENDGDDEELFTHILLPPGSSKPTTVVAPQPEPPPAVVAPPPAAETPTPAKPQAAKPNFPACTSDGKSVTTDPDQVANMLQDAFSIANPFVGQELKEDLPIQGFKRCHIRLSVLPIGKQATTQVTVSCVVSMTAPAYVCRSSHGVIAVLDTSKVPMLGLPDHVVLNLTKLSDNHVRIKDADGKFMNNTYTTAIREDSGTP
jgi:hypothetical protein